MRLVFSLSFVSYLILHFMTSGVVVPLQNAVGISGDHGAALYLPSSIRIFLIWLYGYAGFFVVVFASLTVALLEAGDLASLWGAMPLVLGSPLTVLLAFNFSVQWKARPSRWVYEFSNWKNLVSVAALGGGFNGLMFSTFYGANYFTALTVLVGDVLGLCLGYLVLVPTLRFARSRASR